MKTSILLLFFSILNTFTFGQNDSTTFFDEISVSINQSVVQGTSQIGYGLGAYVTFFSDKKVNLLFGFEYNRANQFQESVYNGHFSHASNMSYVIHSLSLPLSARINVGKRLKLFLEPGVYADFNVSTRRKGTIYTYLPDKNNQINYQEFEVDEKAGVSGVTPGVSLGIGVRIPISKFQLIVKPDFKFGLSALYNDQYQLYNSYFRIMVGVKI